MPRQTINALPMRSRSRMTVVKPSRACPLIFCHRDQQPSTREHRNTSTPRMVTICRGAVEKAARLVTAYRVRLRRDHLDCPAARGCTSNST